MLPKYVEDLLEEEENSYEQIIGNRMWWGRLQWQFANAVRTAMFLQRL